MSHDAPPPLQSGYPPSYPPPPQGPPPNACVALTFHFQAHEEVIYHLLSTGSQIQRVSITSTLPQPRTIRHLSQAFHHRILVIRPPPGRRRASISPLLARLPVNTSHLPVHLPVNSTHHLVLRVKTNGARLLALPLCNPDQLATQGPVPLTRTTVVSLVQT